MQFLLATISRRRLSKEVATRAFEVLFFMLAAAVLAGLLLR
jgi:hypothetical protein